MMTAFWCLQVNGGHSPGVTPPAWIGRQAVAPGRKVACDPRHKAWHVSRQQLGHAEPRVDDQHFVGLQGRSRLCYGSAL